MKSFVQITILALFLMCALAQNNRQPRQVGRQPIQVPRQQTPVQGGIRWYDRNFNQIPNFNAANSAVLSTRPFLRGANVARVGVHPGGTRFTIVYQDRLNTYQAEVSRPFRTMFWQVNSFVQTPRSNPPQTTPTNPVTPVTPILPPSSTSSTIGSTGSLHQGNYVWGGAMNLAWNELVDSFNNRQPLNLSVNNDLGRREAASFNSRPFTTNDLSSDSYYVKSGYGQSTVNQINQEVRQKFPQKSFSDLTVQLGSRDIISYAYFIKEVQYVNPFDKQVSGFYFIPNTGQSTQVQAFKANTAVQRNNIEIVNYRNDDDFILKFKLKQPNDELYVIKGNSNRQPQEIAQLVSGPSQQGSMTQDDKFAMPIVDLDVERQYGELIGSPVVSGQLNGYSIGNMFQKIKFRIDEVGAKVENEAGIIMVTSLPITPPNVKNLILNKPFWVVMKQKGTKPYFITQINNAAFMKAV